MKKALCVLLAVILAFTVAVPMTGAEESAPERVYRYVALGDSIAAGYGLSENEGTFIDDPALIVTEERIADPIKGAYPALFGEKVAEWGQQRGYDVTATNLAACAYRAEDVARVILEEGYVGPIANSLFQILGGSEDNPLTHYHDIFVKYLTDADLVSIQLGGNDLIMGVIAPMTDGSNPILTAIGLSMTLIFIGADTEYALGVAAYILDASKDSITYETVIDALNYLTNFYKKAEECVDLGAENVGKVIDAVRTVNPGADLAVLSIFNPYGNSLEYDGQVQDMKTVFSKIIMDSADYLMSEDASPDAKLRIAALRAIAKSDLSYPLQYLLAGKAIDNLITSLNAKLKAVAADKGAVFVDVYGISNECNLDPHPDAARQKEIAELMAEALQPTVVARMTAAPEATALLGDVDGDGKTDVFDASSIQKSLAGADGYVNYAELDPNDPLFKRADIDGNGVVDIFDASLIQRWLAGDAAVQQYGIGQTAV